MRRGKHKPEAGAPQSFRPRADVRAFSVYQYKGPVIQALLPATLSTSTAGRQHRREGTKDTCKIWEAQGSKSQRTPSKVPGAPTDFILPNTGPEAALVTRCYHTSVSESDFSVSGPKGKTKPSGAASVHTVKTGLVASVHFCILVCWVCFYFVYPSHDSVNILHVNKRLSCDKRQTALIYKEFFNKK